jgi:hypothetical protein
MQKSHECHSEPQAKNLAFPATYEGEILRLSPQDDIATQSRDGGDVRGDLGFFKLRLAALVSVVNIPAR